MSDDIRIPRPGEWCPCGQHGMPHREKDHELLSKGGNVVAKPVFEEALRGLLNSYSKENDSNTPDFILANYIHRCLETWAITTRERERWYGVRHQPGGKMIVDTDKATIGGMHIKCGWGEQGRETIKRSPPLPDDDELIDCIASTVPGEHAEAFHGDMERNGVDDRWCWSCRCGAGGGRKNMTLAEAKKGFDEHKAEAERSSF